MPVARFMPGFRLVTGDQLNKLVDAINGVTNPTAPPQAVDSGGSLAAGVELTPVITTTYIVEMFVPFSQTFTGLAILNGSAVGGNVRLSMADSAGTPIAAALTASTVTAGAATTYQKVPFAAPWVAAGATKYYVLAQWNNAAARPMVHHTGLFGTGTRTAGTFGTFVPVTPPSAFVADVGPICSLYV